MAEPELLDESNPAAVADEHRTGSGPLLGRLNRRGFRLVMLADIVVLLAITFGTMLYRFGLPPWPTYPTTLYLVSFAIVVATFVASLYFGELYEREPRLGAPPVLPKAARQTLAAGGLVALLTLALTGIAREIGLTTDRALPFPIWNLAILITVGAVGVAANRGLVHRLRTRREGPPRGLLVGEATELATARHHLAAAGANVNIVGELDDVDQLLRRVQDTDATDVVLLSRSWMDHLYPEKIERLERAGVTVLLRVTGRETMFGLERVREVGGIPFVRLRSQTVPRSRAHFKRLFDVVVLALSSPLLAPLVGIVALYQRVVAGRPVLFRQERVGAGGRIFRMVKFRTMGVDAEADGGGARLSDANDPRVLPACRWIRATRLDELPQVWNVLRGEMSLVGPRPERPELTEEFERTIPGYGRRHELPPGMTGLAQIHGRYHTDAEYKLGYDLQYLVNWSPVLDAEILVRTLWVVALRRI